MCIILLIICYDYVVQEITEKNKNRVAMHLRKFMMVFAFNKADAVRQMILVIQLVFMDVRLFIVHGW